MNGYLKAAVEGRTYTKEMKTKHDFTSPQG